MRVALSPQHPLKRRVGRERHRPSAADVLRDEQGQSVLRLSQHTGKALVSRKRFAPCSGASDFHAARFLSGESRRITKSDIPAAVGTIFSGSAMCSAGSGEPPAARLSAEFSSIGNSRRGACLRSPPRRNSRSPPASSHPRRHDSLLQRRQVRAGPNTFAGTSPIRYTSYLPGRNNCPSMTFTPPDPPCGSVGNRLECRAIR